MIPTLRDNIKKLNNISRFSYNWNGYDAEPIPKNIIHRVRELLYQFNIQPKIFPTGAPSIQLEWENQITYMEMEYREDGNHILITQDKDYNNLIFLKDVDIQEINNLLNIYF